MVFRLSRNGVEQRINVTPDDGPYFHQNLSNIFRFEDYFILFDGRSLYRWQTNHFHQLLGDQIDDRLADVADHIKQQRGQLDIPNSPGGTQLLNNSDLAYSYSPMEFNWNGLPHVLSKVAVGDLTDLRIERRGTGEEWSATLATFDTRPRPE